MHNVHDRLRQTVIAATVLAGFSITTVAAQSQSKTTASSPSTQTQNVNVVNSPAVAISGTPTVTVSGTPSVNVANQVVARNPDEKGLAPYAAGQFAACAGSPCTLNFAAPPVGTRLVLEHVNATIVSGATVTVMYLFTAQGLWSLPGRSMPGSSSFITVNEPVLVYYGSAQTPGVQVSYEPAASSASFTASISGYLVNLSQ